MAFMVTQMHPDTSSFFSDHGACSLFCDDECVGARSLVELVDCGVRLSCRLAVGGAYRRQ